MTNESLHPDPVHVEEARHLRLIANDLWLSGDMKLVVLSEEGVSDYPASLGDVLWLISARLDPEHMFDQPYDPDRCEERS